MVIVIKKTTFNNLQKDIINSIKKAELNLLSDKKLADTYAFRLANFSARSYRARVSNAPYNYRSKNPGPWSRGGGTPLEKSIYVERVDKGYSVGIKKEGDSKNKGALPPTVYYAFGAKKYLKETKASLKKNAKKLMYDIISNKKG